jgi:hypothetical protein
LTGTWTGLTNLSNNESGGGTLTGSTNASSVSLTLTPTVTTNCPFTVTATQTGNQLTGTFASFNCTVAITGSVSLTKQ